jgi:hypothetical protein
MEYLYKLDAQPTHDIWVVACADETPNEVYIKAGRQTVVEVLFFGNITQIPSPVKRSMPISDTLFMASCIAMQLHCPFDIREVLIFRESKPNSLN